MSVPVEAMVIIAIIVIISIIFILKKIHNLIKENIKLKRINAKHDFWVKSTKESTDFAWKQVNKLSQTLTRLEKGNVWFNRMQRYKLAYEEMCKEAQNYTATMNPNDRSIMNMQAIMERNAS